MKHIIGNFAFVSYTGEPSYVSFTFKNVEGFLSQYITIKSDNIKNLESIDVSTPLFVRKITKPVPVKYERCNEVKLGKFIGMCNDANEPFVFTFNSNVLPGKWKIYFALKNSPPGYYLSRTM